MMKSLQISIFEGHVSAARMQPVAATGVLTWMARSWKVFLGHPIALKQVAAVSRNCMPGEEMQCLQSILQDRALDARGLDAEVLLGPKLSMAFTLPALAGAINRQALEHAGRVWQATLPASLQVGWDVRCVQLADRILGSAIPSTTVRDLQSVLHRAGVGLRACIPGTTGICATPGLADGVHAITETCSTYVAGAPLDLVVIQGGRLVLIARYFMAAQGPTQLRQAILGLVNRIAAQRNCQTLNLHCHGGLAVDPEAKS